MKTQIKYAKLPFRFSVPEMQQEVKALSAEWLMHYNKNDYTGEWAALPLRSIRGSLGNIMVIGSSEEVFTDTALLGQCPYLKTVIDALPCEKMAVRLLNLKPGAIIKEHKDVELNYEKGMARIHIPIMTNKEVDFLLEGERMELQEGDCWYMNFNLVHSLANRGTTDRVHLVMDCVVNDWIKQLFDGDACEIKAMVTVEDAFSAKDREEIIKSLKMMNTAVALEMAERIENGEDIG